MLIEDIVKRVNGFIDNCGGEFKIVDFSFALPYSYVVVEKDGRKSLGVAMTLIEEYRGCNGKKNIINSEIKTINDFINMATEFDISRRSLGLATINAISQYFIQLSKENFNKDIADIILEHKDIKKIAFIGNLACLINTLKENGDFEFYIFERNSKYVGENVISDSFEYALLPKMDAVVISGATLLNSTLDMILDRAKNAKLKILVGPTAQILPEFIKGHGIDYIASIHPVNVDKVIYNLKFGFHFGLFGRYFKKYTICSR